MKTKLSLIVALIGALALTACSNGNQKENVSIANPASVYCEDNGGNLELIFDFGETYGVCHFPDGSFCEEWEYYRGECGPKGEDNIDNEEDEEMSEIHDFESCKAAGNLVHEIYPAICYHEGKSFVQETDEKDGETLGTGNEGNTACTLEAKICPDGTFVGRTGPNCEFAECPGEEIKNEEQVKNEIKKIDEMIKDHAKDIDANSSEITEDSVDLMERMINFLMNLSSKK